MNSADLSWVLALEIALPFIVLSIVLILSILKGRKLYKESAKKLILNVKSSEDQEKQAIINFQTSKLALDEEIAKKNAKKIMNERKFLIRNLISGLLDKNMEAISQLNQDLGRVVGHYHKLEPASGASQEVVDAEVNEDTSSEENEELKSEIKSLKQEVHITLTTLNNIFKEFSSMFGEDDIPDNQMTVDQIITAMESFANKSPEGGEEGLTTDEAESGYAEAAVEDVSVIEEPTDSAELDTQQDLVEDSEAEEAEGQVLDEVIKPLEEDVAPAEEDSDLDFSIDSAIDDIDSALDGLELDASDEEEPDWGDAFAESGDKMEDEPK